MAHGQGAAVGIHPVIAVLGVDRQVALETEAAVSYTHLTLPTSDLV